MDKYEFSMKLDELKRLVANGQFRKAGKVLETIEIKKIKTLKEQYVVVDILIENEKYDQAKEILIGISKKLKSRRVYHQIIDVCIKAGQIDSAKKYMRDFQKLAPKDPYNYVFQYQVAQLAGEGINRQIEILEELKQYEYMEKWAYELAKAYYRAGRDSDCILECNDLVLWFGEGVFVEKARLLKQYLTEAVTSQQILGKVRQIKKEQSQKESTEDKAEGLREIEKSVKQFVLPEEKDNDEEKERFEEDDEIADEPEESYSSYQSAFDYIEDMELREQEHKHQVEEFMPTKLQESNSNENPKWFPPELSDQEDESSSQPESMESDTVETSLDTIPEEQPSVTEQPEKDSMANERQVRELVEETQDCLAAQIGGLFYDEKDSELQVTESTSEQTCDEMVEEIATTISEESGVEEITTTISEGSEVEEPEVPLESTTEEDESESTDTKEEFSAQSEEQSMMEEVVVEDVSQKEREREERIQSAIEEVETRAKKSENLQSKEAVLEDVDKLIRRRRQRATTKKLNASIRAILGEDAEATDYLGQFARMNLLGEDLLKSLESIVAKHNNSVILCICGQSTNVQSYFSRKLAKLLSAMELIPSQTFVLFSKEKLEELSVETYKDKLSGGCIVVEDVDQITENLVKRLQTLLEYHCQIILEFQQEANGPETIEEQQYKIQQDAKAAFARFAESETLLLDSFDEEDYLGFALDFLSEKEYSLEPVAEEYFLSSIKQMMEQENIDVFDQVMDEIAKAYHCANQRNRVELRNIAELGNYLDAKFMSIQLTDFANEN